MRKLFNMLVIAIWVFAQTLTAANSSAHMAPAGEPPVHSADHSVAGHGMDSGSANPAGHSQTNHAMPCPASGTKKAPVDSTDGNCCDHANCHVVDLVLSNMDLGSRRVEIFGSASQNSLVVWAPASPFPPPNSQR